MGLTVSIAGNVGHIQALPGQPVLLADRLTAATSPVAAFAGLTVGLLVLKMTGQHRLADAEQPHVATALVLAPTPSATDLVLSSDAPGEPLVPFRRTGDTPGRHGGTGPSPGLLHDAGEIYQAAAARGERLSQRTLARQLRSRGHRFPNEHLRGIADSIRMSEARAALPTGGPWRPPTRSFAE